MGKPPHFDVTSYDYWKRKMCAHLKSINRNVWEVVDNDFVVINEASSTPREEEKLQNNDIEIDQLYEALDLKVFEKIKDLERMCGRDWKSHMRALRWLRVLSYICSRTST